ncbi:IS481 family transposase [Bogoriella caseilytica]|nr:IS481 family transposase [Bogoriella caseilytica]
MSKRRLVITAVLAGATQSEVARRYGVSQGWISRLMARWRAEGEAAFEPRSRAPKTRPGATAPATVDLVVALRTQLSAQGLDAGAETIAWHLKHDHNTAISRATIHRILTRAGLIDPSPRKRPRASYIRFEAAQPNETWQSDFTHYRLSDGRDAEIITWLDDHSRYALHISAHRPITALIVATTFRDTAGEHGIPASTLTDNGMVYTVRLASQGHRGGRTALEAQLRLWDVIQKNSRPGHPTTCGKVERFQQTMKNWLRAHPHQPATTAELQDLLDQFRHEYNTRRPHRSLPNRATPATLYTSLPKALPGPSRDTQTHERVRHDIIDASGKVTLRHAGRLLKLGIGRDHARTPAILLIQDLDVRVIHATTGEILRELTIDPTRTYQRQSQKRQMG